MGRFALHCSKLGAGLAFRNHKDGWDLRKCILHHFRRRSHGLHREVSAFSHTWDPASGSRSLLLPRRGGASDPRNCPREGNAGVDATIRWQKYRVNRFFPLTHHDDHPTCKLQNYVNWLAKPKKITFFRSLEPGLQIRIHQYFVYQPPALITACNLRVIDSASLFNTLLSNSSHTVIAARIRALFAASVLGMATNSGYWRIISSFRMC